VLERRIRIVLHNVVRGDLFYYVYLVKGLARGFIVGEMGMQVGLGLGLGGSLRLTLVWRSGGFAGMFLTWCPNL